MLSSGLPQGESLILTGRAIILLNRLIFNCSNVGITPLDFQVSNCPAQLSLVLSTLGEPQNAASHAGGGARGIVFLDRLFQHDENKTPSNIGNVNKLSMLADLVNKLLILERLRLLPFRWIARIVANH